MAMVQFKCGEYSGFKALNGVYEQGTIYVTTDEQGIYFAKDNNTAVKLGNIITYDTLKGFTDSTKPPYSADVFYYITESNALIKYNGTKFVQLNSASAEDISDIRTIIGSTTDAVTATTVWGKINKALADIGTINSSLSTTNTAVETAQTKANSAYALAKQADEKADTNAGVIARLKGVVEDGDNSNAKLRAAIGANAGEIDGLKSSVSTVSGVADAAKAKAEANAGSITTINGTLTTINGTLTTHGQNLTNLDERLATAEGTIASHTESIGTLNTGLSTLNSTLTKDYATKEYVGESISDAKEELIGTSTDAKTVNTIYGAKAYANDVKNTVIGTSTDAKTANTIYGAKAYAKDQFDQLSTTVSTLSNNIGNLSNIMNFRGTFNATSDVANPINGDVIIVNTLEYVYVKADGATTGTWEPFGTATADAKRFKDIEDAATALTKRVTDLDKTDGRVDLLEKYVETHKTEFSNLVGRVEALDKTGGRIATIESDITTINNKIGTVAGGKNLSTLLNEEIARATKKEGELSQAITDASDAASSALNAALTWDSF